MPIVRSRILIAMTAGLAIAMAPAFAQNPPNNQGAGQAKVAPARKKKPARRPPRRNGSIGVIAPWMMPPSLIIRQTPDAHDEIQALLNLLRYH